MIIDKSKLSKVTYCVPGIVTSSLQVSVHLVLTPDLGGAGAGDYPLISGRARL